MQADETSQRDFRSSTRSTPVGAEIAQRRGSVEQAACRTNSADALDSTPRAAPRPPSSLGALVRRLREEAGKAPANTSFEHQSAFHCVGAHQVSAAMSPAPDEPFDVDAVCRRYGGCDPRTARRIMSIAGSFTAAGKVWVHHSTLVDYERAATERKGSTTPGTTARKRRPKSSAGPEGVEVLGDDWFREA